MTREEARQVFLSRGYVEVEGGKIYDADKWRESCRVISEWLEQEPCEDVMAIHTQGLDEGIRCAMCTNSMKSNRGCDGGCVVNEGMYREVMNTIKKHIVPPVTPTRKKGKWIEIDDYPNEEYECSVCGRIVEVTSANIKPEEEYPYCHCGAYMGADTGEVEE